MKNGNITLKPHFPRECQEGTATQALSLCRVGDGVTRWMRWEMDEGHFILGTRRFLLIKNSDSSSGQMVSLINGLLSYRQVRNEILKRIQLVYARTVFEWCFLLGTRWTKEIKTFSLQFNGQSKEATTLVWSVLYGCYLIQPWMRTGKWPKGWVGRS